MNRRRFINTMGYFTTTAVVAGCVTVPSRRADAEACSPLASGVQLFTVREGLQKDVAGTLARLAQIGIREAELFGLTGGPDAKVFGLQPAEFAAIARDNGISTPFSHIDGTLTNIGPTAELAHQLGVNTVVIAAPTSFAQMRNGRFTLVPPESLAQLDKLAESLNAAAREYKALGLTFGYHNHHVEFMPVEHVVAYDYLMEKTDPALVLIEMDLGWLASMGLDPVAYLQRYAGRVLACHMKDFDPDVVTDEPARQLFAPGSGKTDFASVLATMQSIGAGHGFIEIDVSDDPFGAIASGHRHLAGLLGCA
ncbi:MAG: sugar phosphate isomerase/epimerase [Gammaproteobacteria bacterium]|nr:sugar phosphate isomerase/epimerase [Gammaproteobacteria bacterium]